MPVPRFYTLWAINAPLDERRLCQQLDAMRAFGFDGAVFHPRFYPGKPAYLSDQYMAVLSRTILYAKSIGMDFWIYDEDGWPSGTVGGQLLRKYPADRQQWADLTLQPPADSDGEALKEMMGAFANVRAPSSPRCQGRQGETRVVDSPASKSNVLKCPKMSPSLSGISKYCHFSRKSLI